MIIVYYRDPAGKIVDTNTSREGKTMEEIAALVDKFNAEPQNKKGRTAAAVEVADDSLEAYLFAHRNERMTTDKAALQEAAAVVYNAGYRDIAKDIYRLAEYIKSANIRVEVMHEQLADVLHAVEWHLSADYGQDTMASTWTHTAPAGRSEPMYEKRVNAQTPAGSTVWVIERDEAGNAVEVCGYVLLARVAGAVIVSPKVYGRDTLEDLMRYYADEYAEYEECDLAVFPESDCYEEKAAASAAFAAETED